MSEYFNSVIYISFNKRKKITFAICTLVILLQLVYLIFFYKPLYDSYFTISYYSTKMRENTLKSFFKNQNDETALTVILNIPQFDSSYYSCIIKSDDFLNTVDREKNYKNLFDISARQKVLWEIDEKNQLIRIHFIHYMPDEAYSLSQKGEKLFIKLLKRKIEEDIKWYTGKIPGLTNNKIKNCKELNSDLIKTLIKIEFLKAQQQTKIVQHAFLPKKAYKDNRAIYILSSIILGIFIGIIAALISENKEFYKKSGV